MPLTEKTRKLLWARSGNQCAYCRAPLIATTSASSESVVGDECHIISGAPDGPRADLGYPREKLDTCENLILLCRVHHKLVDDHPHEYPAEALRTLKARHEHRVAAALAASTPRNPDYLLRIETGADLLTIVIGACAYQYSRRLQIAFCVSARARGNHRAAIRRPRVKPAAAETLGRRKL